MPTLYQYPVSQPCRAVNWFIATHKISDITLKTVDIFKGEFATEEYTAKNPMQTVPALELEDGKVFTESGTILMYLAKKYEVKGELPEGPLGDLKMIEAMLQHAEMARKLTFIVRVGLGARTQNPATPVEDLKKAIEAEEASYAWSLGLVEKQLGKTKFIAGDEWTLADYLVASEVSQWELMGSFLPESLQLAKFPNVQRYLAEVSKRDGYDAFVAPFVGAMKAFGFLAEKAAEESK